MVSSATLPGAAFAAAGEPTLWLNQEGLGQLVGADALPLPAYRLLWAILGLVESGNYLYGSHRSIAREIGMQYAPARRAWQALEGVGVLVAEDEGTDRVRRWRVSPSLCWAGRLRTVGRAQAIWDAEERLRAVQRALQGQAPGGESPRERKDP